MELTIPVYIAPLSSEARQVTIPTGPYRLNFHPHSYPDYDPAVCAATAVAKRHGYVPRHLPEDVRRYLEAGLADGYPEPLYPRIIHSAML